MVYITQNIYGYIYIGNEDSIGKWEKAIIKTLSIFFWFNKKNNNINILYEKC